MKASPDDFLLESEEYLVIPASYLRIPGLHTFGYAKFTQAGEPLEEHYHPGCVEITVMIGGSQVYYAENTTFVMNAGDVFTNFNSEVHSTGNEPQGISEYYFFELDLRKPEGFLGLAHPWDRQLYEKVAAWNRRMVKASEEELTLVRQAFECFAELVRSPENTQKRLLGMGLLLAFFNLLLSKQRLSSSVSRNIQKALDYIEDHVKGALDVETVAVSVGLSSSWLKRKFREEMGITVREYISRRKVEEAKVLLQSRDMRLTEIAYVLGFNDSSYFATVFRQFAGCSPREYRRQYLRQG